MKISIKTIKNNENYSFLHIFKGISIERYEGDVLRNLAWYNKEIGTFKVIEHQSKRNTTHEFYGCSYDIGSYSNFIGVNEFALNILDSMYDYLSVNLGKVTLELKLDYKRFRNESLYDHKDCYLWFDYFSNDNLSHKKFKNIILKNIPYRKIENYMEKHGFFIKNKKELRLFLKELIENKISNHICL